MMRIKELTQDYVGLEVSGKLVRRDYDFVVPELARLMAANHGRLNVLVELNEFKGWEPQALGREVRFDLKHEHDVGRVAVVGDRFTETLGAALAKPMFSGDLRFFDRDALSAAREWLRTGEASN